MNLFNDLKARNAELTVMIDTAGRMGNDAEAIKLKKELYANKLEMLNILTVTQTRSGVTARQLKAEVESRPKIPRYETGISALDTKLHGGIEIGTFIQMAGESGVGKTHFQLEVLSNIANGNKAVFFNFEMGDVRIINRLNRMMTNPVQWDNLIIDKDSRDIDTLCNEIILYAKDGIKFFTIDSKMKLDVQGEKQEYQKISLISKRLAELAQKQEVIIFLINQMNEEDIKNKRLAFKGSGDQKYDADIALFYVKDKEGKRRLICTKNRQDEEEFAINLRLSEEGKTVEDREVRVIHQDKEGRFTGSAEVTEYKHDDSVSMISI